MFINENNNYDIAVCGGGFAGISAALAAAREGKKVILFEKEYILGGLGTAGLVTIYLPLCDGIGHQVSFGIAEELFRLSIKYGAEARYPENWLDGVGTRTEKDKRFQVQYNPQVFAILAEQLLIGAGVDILYGSYVVDAFVKENKIVYLTVENKSGRCEYYVKSVVDATGDADIARYSGAPTETYRPGNLLAAWYYFTDSEGYHLKTLGSAHMPKTMPQGKEAEMYSRTYSGIEAEELSETLCKRLQESGYGAELDTQILQKTRETAQQKHMDRKERQENVAGAYHVHKRKECRDRTIILVDDIMTTGATGSECAARLLGAGAKEVIFLVAASLPEMR